MLSLDFGPYLFPSVLINSRAYSPKAKSQIIPHYHVQDMLRMHDCVSHQSKDDVFYAKPYLVCFLANTSNLLIKNVYISSSFNLPQRRYSRSRRAIFPQLQLIKASMSVLFRET